MPGALRLLLTNDDGFDAPGIAALGKATAGLGSALIVAPVGPQSGCSHRVTASGPITVHDRGEGHFAVDGTPADCVRLALHHLTGAVDWIISGINAGGNLGVDVHRSGTVAAVREGVIHGIPGIAISHYIGKDRSIDWDRATRWTAEILPLLIARPTPPETFWNVNLPHPGPEIQSLPEVVYCQVDPSPHPLDYLVGPGSAEYKSSYQSRPRRPGWDIDVCFGGRVAVSLVHLMESVERFDPAD